MMIFWDLIRRSEMREWGDGEMGCVDNATNRTKGKTKGKRREGQGPKGGRDEETCRMFFGESFGKLFLFSKFAKESAI